jgi:hypothetical protein
LTAAELPERIDALFPKKSRLPWYRRGEAKAAGRESRATDNNPARSFAAELPPGI